MLPISAVIFTKNEHSNIQECIESLEGFGEIVVIDSDSSDDTCEIARRLGARVVFFKWNGELPKKREWTLRNVAFVYDWILFVDADERISEPLKLELGNFVEKDFQSQKYNAGIFEIGYAFAGRHMRFGYRPSKIALLKHRFCYFPEIEDNEETSMGELEGHFQPRVSGRVRRFRNSILHNDRDPIETWYLRHLKYAKWDAFISNSETLLHKVRSNKSRSGKYFSKLSRWRIPAIFMYSYLLKFGFLDGWTGYFYARSLGWYYMMSELLKEETKKHLTGIKNG